MVPFFESIPAIGPQGYGEGISCSLAGNVQQRHYALLDSRYGEKEIAQKLCTLKTCAWREP